MYTPRTGSILRYQYVTDDDLATNVKHRAK